MLKTVQDIIDSLDPVRQEIRWNYWTEINAHIAIGNYRHVLERILGNRCDYDWSTQMRCVAESIAQHRDEQDNA